MAKGPQGIFKQDFSNKWLNRPLYGDNGDDGGGGESYKRKTGL